MSYRIEKKYIINPNKSEIFINDLIRAGANKIYKKRIIFSTYYDNDYLTSYSNSEEGIVPRKKIRIRSYDIDKHSEVSKLEFKISSEINRFKETKKFKNKSEFIKISKKGYLDKFYGYCKPKINVTYEREYFLLNQTRVTLDKNITYSNMNLVKSKFSEPLSVVEFKSNINDEMNINNYFLSNSISRFSKYCRAVNAIIFKKKSYQL